MLNDDDPTPNYPSPCSVNLPPFNPPCDPKTSNTDQINPRTKLAGLGVAHLQQGNYEEADKAFLQVWIDSLLGVCLVRALDIT